MIESNGKVLDHRDLLLDKHTSRIVMRTSDTTKEYLRGYAQADGISLSRYINIILAKHIEHIELKTNEKEMWDERVE